MKLVRFGAAVLNQTPLDWERNEGNILRAIKAAQTDGVSVLCLPEMCIPGYGCEDAFQSPGTQRTSLDVLTSIVPETRNLIVCLGLPLLFQNRLHNAACLVADGQILGFVCKRYLAGDGIHYEPRWFKPWPEGLQAEISILDHSYPVGDLVFDIGGMRIGFEICEDAWMAKRPGGELSLAGTDVIMNPSASHFAFDKFDVRKRFVLEGSRAFGVTYLYSNLVGNEAGRIIYDGGALIAAEGKLVAAGTRLSFTEVEVTSAVVDLDATRAAKARVGAVDPPTHGPKLGQVSFDFDFPALDPVRDEPASATWETGDFIKEEEFARAVSLGLFDYLRKSRSHGFVVSTSGGADSSAVACLVALMVELSVSELGIDAVRERLGYIDSLRDAANTRELTHQLLTTVYQSTRNSSETTRSAASAVAKAIGSRHLELDVDALMTGYVDLIGAALDTDLDWKRHDLALQNIQARARGPSVWMIANLRNALLLATSNRSEAAVGYATMDGDTCGGLSPIAGIDKAFLRTWLRWLEHHGPDDLRAVPELHAVNVQEPTAELRPPDAKQTDEDDLMPYDVLDTIERLAIGDKQTPVEVYRIARTRFPGTDDKLLATWVERFFRLWCRNQWKRERYAPSFHLDDENLDPKTWCRFPILSGNYDRELEELREYVKHS